MKKLRILSLSLALVLVLSLLAGCNSNTPAPTTASTSAPTAAPTTAAAATQTAVPAATTDVANATLSTSLTTFPIVSEPITLNITNIRSSEQAENYNDITIWQEYEKMTNIHVEWKSFDRSSDSRDKLYLEMAAGDVPDAYLNFNVPAVNMVRYGGQGVFLKLNDYLADYAPNFSQLTQERPEILAGIRTPEGSIYGLPSLYLEIGTLITTKHFFNQKWMDAAGVTLPKTPDDLVNVLRAFRDNDVSGRGLNDERPLVNEAATVRTYLAGAFGINNRGLNGDLVDFNEATNELRFVPTTPEYKELVEYIRLLYQEELLDNEAAFATWDSTNYLALGNENLIGSNIFQHDMYCLPKEDYVAAPEPYIGPHGDQAYSARRSPIGSLSGIIITNKNNYVEETLRWADYFYSDEGAKMFLLGIEGVSYYQKEDGTYSYLEEIMNSPEMYSEISKHVTWTGLQHVGMRVEQYGSGIGQNNAKSVAAALSLAKFAPAENVWPAFFYTAEENSQMSVLANDITTYRDQSFAQFVTGSASFDTWDSYVSQYEKMGLSEYMELFTTAYERYRDTPTN